MKLLYCHVGFLDANGNKKRFRGLEQINLNLSSSHVFSYDSCDSVLRKRLRDKPLPEHFWANGDKETNLYNINVVAGKNGSGKSTVINYVIDLLYYIYLDFGRQQSNIPKSARFDVEQNYNLLVFEENGSLYVVELLPEGKKKRRAKNAKSLKVVKNTG
jgi:Excinuclease ATPase subunit